MSNKEVPLLLTVREVSALLRVQRPKVYELIKDGAIDGFKSVQTGESAEIQ